AAAAYWSGPLDNEGDWRTDPEIAAFVRRVAPRGVATETGLAEIENFAKTATVDRPRRLALIFRGLLEETDRERAGLISRLTQMGRPQAELPEPPGRLAEELRSVPHDATGEAAEKRVDLQQ